MNSREKSFLIVEDSSVDLHLIQKFLHRLGYNLVTAVASGEEAIRKVEEMKPDLIFMDIFLEGEMTGIETHSAITEKYDIPVIFTTGYADNELINRVKDLTPYGYLVKPYDRSNLHVSIEIALKRHELDKEILNANREIDALNRDLKRNLEMLNLANKSLCLSEERYRLLVEGSNEIIFSMDQNWKILTINKAIGSILNITPGKVLSRPFFDLLYRGNGDDNISGRLVKEKLDEFSGGSGPVIFKTMFKSSISTEPKELQVRLEHINIEGRNEIFGKASRILDDSLLNFFISEKQKYVIESSLVAAEDISYRITRNLLKYMENKQVNLLRVSLREVIINSVEHGNLGITFDEKTRAVSEGSYIDYLSSKQTDPKLKGKKIIIEYSLNPRRVVYSVTDEGEGFDHEKTMKKNIHDPDRISLGHGRGLTMVMNSFDEIRFNKKGNQVLLVKRLQD